MNLLQAELRDVQRYSSILAAIAGGCTKSGEIIGRVKEIADARALSPYLERLHRMHLIRPTKSMDASERERDRRYFLADPLMTFWFRFIQPNLSSIARDFGAEVYRHQIAPALDDYMGFQFEEICREHARRYIDEHTGVPAQQVGQVWNADYDIDVAGTLLDRAAIYGECKWWIDPVGENVLQTLIERADVTTYGRDAKKRFLALYSRKGFTEDVLRRAKLDPTLLLFTPSTLFSKQPATSRSPRRSTAKKRPAPAVRKKK